MSGASWIIALLFIAVGVVIGRDNNTQTDYFEQRAVDHLGNIIPFQANLSLGQFCINSGECISGCCLRRRRPRFRGCAPKALEGRRCNDVQVKGGRYRRYCPCASGDPCLDGRCPTT